MLRALTAVSLALALALASTSDGAAKASSRAKKAPASGKVSAAPYRGDAARGKSVRGRVAYAPSRYSAPGRHRAGYKDLVGNYYSGYGFYALPAAIQIAAARYRQRYYARPWWRNPVLSAMAADAMRMPCYVPANEAYRCGVFNPIDGVGTPFFAGYYR